MNGTRPSSVAAWRGPLLARWRALAPRERSAASVAVAAVVLLLVWWVAIQPAWRTLRDAPAQLDRLDAELQHMQRLATEGQELRKMPPVSAAQSGTALHAATARLGERGRLALVGDRATLTLSGVSGEELRSWLADARSGARARPLQAQLSRGPQGYSGTIVVALGGAAG